MKKYNILDCEVSQSYERVENIQKKRLQLNVDS
jgi:hypothetical protein